MRTRLWALTAVLMGALATGPVVNAGQDPCAGYEVTTIDTGTAETLYLASPSGHTGTYWLYSELNGLPGLQRGDSFDPWLDDGDGPLNWYDRADRCWQGHPPDQAIAWFEA